MDLKRKQIKVTAETSKLRRWRFVEIHDQLATCLEEYDSAGPLLNTLKQVVSINDVLRIDVDASPITPCQGLIFNAGFE